MKKRAFIKILVAMVLLSSILVSSLLGVTKAEYYKKLSHKLDFEYKPDLMLEYYLYDNSSYTSTSKSDLAGENGVYKNAEKFVQTIVVGKTYSINNKKYAQSDGSLHAADTRYTGGDIVYQIKIPVDETGYYTLDFNSYFRFGGDDKSTDYTNREFYSLSPIYALGCEILTATDGVDFYSVSDTPADFDMSQRQFLTDSRVPNTQSDQTLSSGVTKEGLLYSDTAVDSSKTPQDSVYQWKTLCPSRSENVRLTFKVEDADVRKGYVIWTWDLNGLQGGHNYRLFVDSLSITKTMELPEDMEDTMGDEPYFIFPQTAYLNNMYYTDGTVTDDNKSKVGPGYSRYSSGRGTYVTEATQNSLGMRAEVIYRDKNQATQNPISLYIPLKNIKYDTTYKVTFDFSVAKQGNNGVDYFAVNGDYLANNRDYHNYDDFSDIFELSTNGAAQFQSYIAPDLTATYSYNGHTNTQDKIKYADKTYTSYPSGSGSTTFGYPLTKYDEITKLGTINHTTTMSVNNTYCNAFTQHNDAELNRSQSRNWFNAVQHTEYNGQYKINWITFYNTTFSFNIPKADNGSIDLDTLYWVWSIDALKYKAFYNIRIDNVRIERVVKYSSYLDANGVKIGGTKIKLEDHSVAYDAANPGYNSEGDKVGAAYDVLNIFSSFRGINGTGQNFQAKGFVQDAGKNVDFGTKTFTADGNIYAPILDATEFVVRPDKSATDSSPSESAYKIELDGFAVCEGGVNKYVFSVDGGKTWHDMTFTGADATEERLEDASRGVNQYTSGQSRYEKSDFPTSGTHVYTKYTHLKNELFTATDGKNAFFDGFTLVADLTEYKYMANLDVIIAAVPLKDPDYRCEILRIINFNQSPDYVSYATNIYSDTEVYHDDISPDNVHIKDKFTTLNAYYKGYSADHMSAENTDSFSLQRGWNLNENKADTSPTGYSLHTSNTFDYDEIRALYSNFATKRYMGVQGWFFVDGEIFNEYDACKWSVDGGLTWNDCTDRAAVRQSDFTLFPSSSQSEVTDEGKKWMNKTSYPANSQGKFFNGYTNDNETAYATEYSSANKYTLAYEADLKDYEGQVVDIIFAGKAKQSDVYCPIAKIDNVAVYGEEGTFYTRVHDVIFDRNNSAYRKDPAPTNEHVGKGVVPLYYYKDRNFSAKKDVTIKSLNLRERWYYIGYSSESYAIFEPQNVNAVNARMYNNAINPIQSGGKVTIDGYVACHGGVKQYKYSLDGGVTWTIINDTGTTLTQTMLDYSKRSDGSFNLDDGDGNNGNFCCTNYAEGSEGRDNTGTSGTYFDHALEFNLPAIPVGQIRNLLVVAESNNNKLIPVLNIRVQFTNNSGKTQYGYYRNTSSGGIESGWISTSNAWTFPVAKAATHRNIMTIPVTEAQKGSTYKLQFIAEMQNTDGTTSKTYSMNGGKVRFNIFHDSGNITMLADLSTRVPTTDSRFISTVAGTGHTQTVKLPLTITDADVKRGYIVLDIDVSRLETSGTTYDKYKLTLSGFQFVTS